MQINQNRAFIATEKFTQSPIKLTSAPAGHIGNLVAKLRKLVLRF